MCTRSWAKEKETKKTNNAKMHVHWFTLKEKGDQGAPCTRFSALFKPNFDIIKVYKKDFWFTEIFILSIKMGPFKIILDWATFRVGKTFMTQE